MNFSDAISGIESGGRYGLLGPIVKNGDRAYGRYQVMGSNIPQWTQEVLGQSMTPQQFLASPQAQDAVFNAKFGNYVQKYGPEGAARAWFAGEGGMNDPNRRDVLGTSVADYARKFNAGMGSPISQAFAYAPMQAPQFAGQPMPLFAPQTQQPQPQAQQLAQQSDPSAQSFSLFGLPMSQTDLANFWARQNPLG